MNSALTEGHNACCTVRRGFVFGGLRILMEVKNTSSPLYSNMLFDTQTILHVGGSNFVQNFHCFLIMWISVIFAQPILHDL
jgi:hypothetical protein